MDATHRLTTLLALAALLASAPCHAAVTHRQVVEHNLTPSYVTAMGGLNLSGSHGTVTSLLFEADLNQHLSFQPGPLQGWAFIKIDPRIRLRMWRTESNPVRTPSFMPRATLFLGYGGDANTSSDGFGYWSLMLSHHSNGQAGSFYNTDGTINTLTGSFSTNFVELGYNRAHARTAGGSLLRSWTRLSLIGHIPDFNRSRRLDDQYEMVKVAATGTLTRLPTVRGTRALSAIGGLPLLSWLGNYSARLGWKASYVVTGRKYTFVPGPGAADPTPRKASVADRIDLSGNVNLGRTETGDFRWFAKFDYGYDYYNIHFFRRLRRIQVGIVADPYSLAR